MSPQGGYSVKIVRIFLSPKYYLWVVLTCVSRNLTQCKRNQLNPITLPGENVQNVVQICCFCPSSKYPNIYAHFGRFLQVGWSVWADFFCIESGFLRHKFILPTRGLFLKTPTLIFGDLKLKSAKERVGGTDKQYGLYCIEIKYQ
jgi:hypothetical protein